MLFGALDLETLLYHARRGGTDLVLGFKLDSLRCQGAMIDARFDIECGEPFVDMIGPGFAPVGQQLGTVPVAHLGAELGRSVLAVPADRTRVRAETGVDV